MRSVYVPDDWLTIVKAPGPEIEDALLKTADILAERGVARHRRMRGPRGEVCFAVALNATDCADTPSAIGAFGHFLRVRSIVDWQDEHTDEEVIGALRACAATYQNPSFSQSEKEDK